MINILNFIKLDLLTIKPYLTDKRLLIYLALAIMLPYGNNEPTSAIAMMMIFTMLISTYPFAVADQNNLDTLYIALNIKRKDVVIGRYFTLFILYLAGAILGTTLYLGLSIFMKHPINIKEVFFLISLLFIFLSLSQSFQFPFFFKNGYLNAKAVTYLPFGIISVLVLLGSQLYQNGFNQVMDNIIQILQTNLVLSIILLLVIWLSIMFISYKISYKYYAVKEL